MIGAKVRIDGALRRLARFRSALSSQLRGGRGPVGDAMKVWQRRTLAFLQERFLRMSKGGRGGWKKHAPSTVAKRGPGAPILYDTTRLYRGMKILGAGSKPGFEVGYGPKSGKYPRGPAVQTVAAAHQSGNDRLPKRVIIVPPDDATRKAMARDMDNALDKLADST